MSSPGKFIPGGAGRKTIGLDAAAPIRAPAGPSAPSDPAARKRLFSRGTGLMKPVSRERRFPITLMSVAAVCLLFFAAYFLAYLPEVRQVAAQKKLLQLAQSKLADQQAAAQRAQDELKKKLSAIIAATTATVAVDTVPPGAAITIGAEQKTAPASFTDLPPGKISVLVQADGYEDYRQDLTVTTEKPVDLGLVRLVPKTGSVAFTCAEPGVTYTLTGPNGYNHQAAVPDRLDKLPAGDYQLTVALNDWVLPPAPLTVRDRETVQKEIKLPYATLAIQTAPPGATIRQGRVILGVTPVTLPKLKPGDMTFSVDLPPYLFQRVTVTLPDFGNVTRQITLQRGRDFLAACGMPMVWIPDGGYWVGKYEVRQSDFETVTGINPSTFRKPSKPVETINWDGAMAFCDRLNAYEEKAGRLPAGYHYTLPTETQWSSFSADADIDQAAMSRRNSLSSTQDVGASEPNKYGLYDTLGNVWEWCLDPYNSATTHSLRGGGWLSSSENFPTPETRIGAISTYADRFTGFRVVLTTR
jgi:hypothetical protein